MGPLGQDTPTSALLDGRYQLLECVGQGGMGQVYRAEDLVLGRIVAIKMMQADSDVLGSPARARNEMTVLAGLNHPSLVKLLDGSAVPGRPAYLVMEFVEGDTLAQRVATGPLPPVDVAHLGSELASALHAVHAAGVVHRDVKPSNILLASNALPGRRYHAKLADFGVAYLLDSTHVTTPGTVIGTAAYLAPEQVRGEPIAPAADIYALGLVLLEALTGERAYPHASGIGAVMARLLESPTIPEHLGPEWTRLLSRMTATDAATRPSAIDVADSALAIAAGASSVPLVPAAVAAVAEAPVLSAAEETSVTSAVAAHTLPLPVPVPVPVSVPAPTRRVSSDARRRRTTAGRKKRATALIGSVAAAAVLAVGWGIWTAAPGAGAPAPAPTVALVTEPTSPVAPLVEEVGSYVETVADPVPQPEPEQVAPVAAVSDGEGDATTPETPATPTDEAQAQAEEAAEQAAAQQKTAADAARKQAEEAQKQAETVRRDAEKAQRDAEKAQAKAAEEAGQ